MTESKKLDESEDIFSTSGGNTYKKYTIGVMDEVYFSDVVQKESDTPEFCHMLRSYQPQDVVNLYMGNYGGDCAIGGRLADAMKSCKARLNVIVDMPCYSMGSLLALCGDSVTITDGNFLHFHNYTSFAFGKGGELKDSVLHTDRWLDRLVRRCTMPFLTEAEIKRLQRDKDVYVHWDDKSLRKRLQRHFKGIK